MSPAVILLKVVASGLALAGGELTRVSMFIRFAQRKGVKPGQDPAKVLNKENAKAILIFGRANIAICWGAILLVLVGIWSS